MNREYTGMISSDWNGCLAPCGPFDPISFAYPELEADLSRLFRAYTGNQLSLSEAVQQLRRLLPRPFSPEKMDAYLETSFLTYKGVVILMRWCMEQGILFMINTTGMQGYFQRSLAKRLLPPGIVVAANPMISFPGYEGLMYDVGEIEDKSKTTEAVLREQGIPAERLIIMGDSGGDGPHFAWGASVGAHLVGSMPKASLKRYCREKGVAIDTCFGLAYEEGEEKNPEKEMAVDFMGLVPVIETVLSS